MRYLPLLNLYLTHAYYADRRCPDFQVEPTPQTRRLLNNYRCVVKPLSNGVRILTAADGGAPFIRMDKGMAFAFQLILRNPDFALFTDLAESGPAARLYTNERVDIGTQVPLKLIAPQSPPVPRRPNGMFAAVEIAYRDSAPAIDRGPGEFLVDFGAKQAWWKYYLVTDTTSDVFRIADQDRDAPLTFGDGTELKDPAKASDNVAAALAAQYPKLRILRFTSASAIPCRQKPRRSLRLFVGDSLAVETLPNPSIRNYTIDAEAGGVPGKNSLFHVIKFFTNLGSTSGG
jgi:hypothetical protein